MTTYKKWLSLWGLYIHRSAYKILNKLWSIQNGFILIGHLFPMIGICVKSILTIDVGS